MMPSFRSRRPNLATALLLIGSVFGCAGGDAPPTALEVTRLFYVIPAGDAPGVLYLNIHNRTAQADTLTGLESTAGSRVMVHGPMPSMEPLSVIAIAAGATERLAPGGRHAMVISPLATIHTGDSIQVTLTFARAGKRVLRAAVISYADVDTATAVSAAQRE